MESTTVTRSFPASDLVVLGSSCDDDETSAASMRPQLDNSRCRATMTLFWLQ